MTNGGHYYTDLLADCHPPPPSCTLIAIFLVWVAGRCRVRSSEGDADGSLLADVRNRVRAVDSVPPHLLSHAEGA